MKSSRELSIFDYAKNINKESKLLTFYSVFKILLEDIDCIVCLVSAADLLGYSNGGFRKYIYVYTNRELNLPYIKCFIVDDIDKINCIDYKGIKVTPIENAIVDMLNRDSTDIQMLSETFAHYYFCHNKSYDTLLIPKELESKANYFKEVGITFYEE